MAVDYVTPLDRLGAVNLMIENIGQAPLNTLTGTLTADISLALNILDRETRRVQAKGWHFNTENEYPLQPDVNGNVAVPDNISRADFDTTLYSRSSYDAVIRGSGTTRRLYDRKNRTFAWIVGTTLKLSVTLILPFDEIPDEARDYITIRAARRFQQRTLGSDNLDQFTDRDEFDALVALKDMESDTSDATIFDHYDAYEALDRAS